MSEGLILETQKNKTLQILTCRIGHYVFGMNVEKCREVNRNLPIARVPFARNYISGIVNLRGDVATVINLHVLLGFHTADEEGNIRGESPKKAGEDTAKTGDDEWVIIRLKSEKKHVALRADSVSDVIDISAEKLEPVPSHLDDIGTEYLSAAVKLPDELVLIIDTDAILNLKH